MTLHNTTAGKTYQIFSRQSFSTGSWIDETTILGASGQDYTEVTVQKNGRPILFFRALEVGPNRIQTENAITGTDDWRLTPGQEATPGWPANADSTTPEIEGFASATSVNVGETLDLYVDVRSGGTNYTIEVYRMGWCGGLGGRKMGSTISKTNGTKQKVPGMNSSNGLIDCLLPSPANPDGPWTLSHALAIPSDWVSGVYLAKLTVQSNGKQSYIIFVAREDTRSSDFLFQSSVTTYQAYNPWGGNSLYPYPYVWNCSSVPNCPDCQPARQQATKVSFNRPYAGPKCQPLLNYGNGAGEFLVMINQDARPGWEYNMVRWLERQGYDVTYSTSIDTHRAWPCKNVKAFLSVGHDEYWSQEMRDHVTEARDRVVNPVNLAFFAANVCYWKIHFEADDDRVFAVDKSTVDYDHYPDLWRGAHSNNSTDYPAEIEMIGVEYVFNSLDRAMTIRNPLQPGSGIEGHHWAYDYAGFGGGDVLPGLLGYEVDGSWEGNPCTVVNSPRPPETTILADSPFPVEGCQTGIGHSYVTIYTADSGAQVFATGSMQWNWGLDDFGFGQQLPWSPSQPSPWGPSRVHGAAQQMTHNVLRTFAGRIRVPVIFTNADTVTSGDWSGVYRSDVYKIANWTPDSLPSYAPSVTVQGHQLQVWPDQSSDPRALLKPGSSTERIAAAWTTTEAQNSAFTIDINITDGNTHQIALYCVDWLGTGTILEKIEVFESSDISYSNPIDTRNFTLPTNGVYLIWKLSGHKIIRITKPDATLGNKAMASGLFFGSGD